MNQHPRALGHDSAGNRFAYARCTAGYQNGFVFETHDR
jgi:hypothetical protein